MRSARSFTGACGVVAIILWLSGAAFGVASNYARALANVLVSEGGWSNDAHDPGGVTLNGIIQVEYNRYRRNKGEPRRALTRAMLSDPVWISERDEIYQINYAVPCGFNDLPAGLDFSLFDYCVNSGIGRAPKKLREILGLPSGSHIDAAVIAEVNKRDAKVLIRAVNDERIKFLRGLSTYRYFGTGWSRRVASVRAISLSMAGGPQGSGTLFRPAFGPHKAYDDEALEQIIP